VVLEPHELAFEFARMDDTDQAKFFSELAKLVGQWERPFCFQLQYLADNDHLTAEGKSIMRLIGEYGKDQ
jgi:hypothetical protein